METDLIERVRDFNRFYTERLGLLTDHYLGLDRPLGPSRLLWEIGDRAAVRELRDRLGLDSGYLSRLLRALEEQGLIRVLPHPTDGRARVVQPTEAGRRERRVLDERSRAGVATLLGELSPAQRDELVAAQQRIRRLLRLATVTVAPVTADDPQAWQCLHRYAAELAERFPEGYDEAILTRPEDIDGQLLLACEQGRPVGCGVWVHLTSDIAEIRHLWTDPTARGLGLGRRLMTHLEADITARGVRTVRLGTHGVLGEAIALYRSSGYRDITGYSPSPYNQLCFEKRLGPAGSDAPGAA